MCEKVIVTGPGSVPIRQIDPHEETHFLSHRTFCTALSEREHKEGFGAVPFQILFSQSLCVCFVSFLGPALPIVCLAPSIAYVDTMHDTVQL